MSDDRSPYVYEPDRCPLTAALDVIGGKWKGLIWWRLREGMGRFNELRRCFPMISQKMLTQQLRVLERDGVVKRKEFPEVPPRVEYTLTDLGDSLEPVILSLCGWGQSYLEGSLGVGSRCREVKEAG